MTKFCVDCKYYSTEKKGFWPWSKPPADEFARCTHPTAVIRRNSEFLVTRQVSMNTHYSCSTMRTVSCGTEARLFEPKG